MKTRVPFYHDTKYRNKKVMFELIERPYSSQVGLHLTDGDHIPDCYLIDFDNQGVYLERAISRFIGDEALDLDEKSGRLMKITGVDDI